MCNNCASSVPKHYQTTYLGAPVLIASFSTIPRAWWEVLCDMGQQNKTNKQNKQSTFFLNE
jgi:hypothetical protein